MKLLGQIVETNFDGQSKIEKKTVIQLGQEQQDKLLGKENEENAGTGKCSVVWHAYMVLQCS